MATASVIWLQFALCGALIGFAGYQLSHYGDAIAQRTGLSGSWVGLALVGLFFKPRSRLLRAVSWVSLGLVAMYLLNTYVLYLYGE